ncbi:MAG: hypothetical protein HQK83_11550 [Fibrobacteria bacterium]|nr:hypothetical protein [Fibrobacteria bacterium]
MINVFLIGKTETVRDKLTECYLKINKDSEYMLNVNFQYIQKDNWRQSLPRVPQGLVFFEITESDTKAEMLTIQNMLRIHRGLQLVLVTDSSIDYFEIARVYNIGNILKKDLFDHYVVRAITIRLMTGNIFGFKPYFPDGYTVGPLYKTVSGTVEMKDIMAFFEKEFLKYVDQEVNYKLRSYFYELLANTIAYSVVGITPDVRDSGLFDIPATIEIPEEKPFKISMAMDDEKYGFSIMDTSGSLSLQRLLIKLRRQSSIGDEAQPPGIWDLTGRGFSLLLKDNRLIVNIVRNSLTEVIFMHYREKALNKYESIIIAEIAQ